MVHYLRGSSEYSRQGYVTYGQFRNFLMLMPHEVARETDPSRLWFEEKGGEIAVQRAPEIWELRHGRSRRVCGRISVGIYHEYDASLRHSEDASPSCCREGSFAPGAHQERLPSSNRGRCNKASFRPSRVILPATVYARRRMKSCASPSRPPWLCRWSRRPPFRGSVWSRTLLGTCVRIPCEVLKQRLQTDQYPNVPAALKGIVKTNPRALYAGTAATLTREIPFYVTGLMIYENLKKGAVAEGWT